MKKFTLTILALGFWLLALNAQIANTDTTDAGVLINGVVWATRNVDAPGTFAQNPEDIGMLYQYDRNIGWSSNDPLIASNGSTTWNTTYSYSPVWQEENDPCPCGWRVPTPTELQSLVDAGSVFTDYYNHYDGGVCSGRIFGDYFNENFIFLRSYSCRGNNGTLGIIAEIIAGAQPYWSNTRKEIIGEEIVFIYVLSLNSSMPENYTYYAVAYNYGISANPVRCVKNEQVECESECIYTLNVFSGNNNLGYVQGMSNNQIIISTPDNTSIVFCGAAKFTATPKENAVFTGWNDGNTDNPRIVNVASDTTFIANFITTGASVENILAENIKIFPNPVILELKIENEELKVNSVEILDITGKLFYSSQFSINTINVSNLQQGIYLLKIGTDKGIIVEKFVKK